MNNTLLTISFGMLTVSIMLTLYRLVRGPSTSDRILAFETLAICGGAMIVLLSIRWGTVMFVELILVTAALGFVGTMAFVFYLSRHVDEHRGGEQIKKESE